MGDLVQRVWALHMARRHQLVQLLGEESFGKV